jgi:hypothetical protein
LSCSHLQEERDYKSRLKAANSDESKRKISEKAKERFSDPEYRKHFEENVWNNPEVKEKVLQKRNEWFSRWSSSPSLPTSICLMLSTWRCSNRMNTAKP